MDELIRAAADLERDPRTHALRLVYALLRQRGLDPDVILANDDDTRELVTRIIDQAAEPIVAQIAAALDDVLHPPGSPTH